MPKVFFITGTSTGFGANLVQEVIDRGDIAVATARKPETLKFNNTSDKNFLALKLDVTDTAQVEAAFKAALEKFKRVDVVTNNGGIGIGGVFEELSEEQVRKQMEVNFFGLTHVTRKAMSVMREQSPSGGVIQQVTSIGGQRGVPLFSIYCASKWAVEGFTEALSKEVKPEWNIKFTCIEPGAFRTDWAGRSMEFPDEERKMKKEYDHLQAEEKMESMNGKQDGDPKKGAKAMYDFAVMEDPPLRVVIGKDAYQGIQTKLKEYGENYKRFEKISTSTDFDK